MAQHQMLHERSLTAYHPKDPETESCFTQVGLEDILLHLVLGHSLPCSQSQFALLPLEVMQLDLAEQVRCLFFQELRCRGFMTPVEILEPCLAPDFSRGPPPIVRKKRVCTARENMDGFKRNRLEFPDYRKQGRDDHERAELARVFIRSAFSTIPSRGTASMLLQVGADKSPE